MSVCLGLLDERGCLLSKVADKVRVVLAYRHRQSHHREKEQLLKVVGSWRGSIGLQGEVNSTSHADKDRSRKKPNYVHPSKCIFRINTTKKHHSSAVELNG